MDAQEQARIADEIMEICSEQSRIFEEDLGQVLPKVLMMAEDADDPSQIKTAVTALLSAPDPFKWVHDEIYGIREGWKAWSAVAGDDDLRIPEYVGDFLENCDTLFYLPKLARSLEGDSSLQGEQETDDIVYIDEQFSNATAAIFETMVPLFETYNIDRSWEWLN